MTLIVILTLFYGLIVYQEEKKWETHKWTQLMNSGN